MSLSTGLEGLEVGVDAGQDRDPRTGLGFLSLPLAPVGPLVLGQAGRVPAPLELPQPLIAHPRPASANGLRAGGRQAERYFQPPPKAR